MNLNRSITFGQKSSTVGFKQVIMGRVLDPLLCVFLADIQSVDTGACMHVCVWYTELTSILNGVSKTDIVVGKVQCVCVCVLTDGGATPVAGRP